MIIGDYYVVVVLCWTELLYYSPGLCCTLSGPLDHLSRGAAPYALHPLKLALTAWPTVATISKRHET